MKKAFSLAEVLLALAIVGIIAALAIPVFYNSYSERVLETKLKKTCTQIMTATKEIMSDERSEDTELLVGDSGDIIGFYYTSAFAKTSNSTQGVKYFLDNYFKTSRKDCGPNGSKECVGTTYKSTENKDLGAIPSNYYCIKTANSAAICMARIDDIMKVIVDINAADSPNVTGVDTFAMYISNNGDLKDIDSNTANCNKGGSATVYAYAAGCFAKVVENGWKMPK